MAGTQVIDMTGKRFQRLLVLYRAGTFKRNATWACLCGCGAETIVTGANLRNGSTGSCGCLNRKRNREQSKRNIRHGHARRAKKTSEYMALSNALYGSATPVCKRWRNSFSAFLADLGVKPSPAHRLTRLDKAKGFSPTNCTWAKDARLRDAPSETGRRQRRG